MAAHHQTLRGQAHSSDTGQFTPSVAPGIRSKHCLAIEVVLTLSNSISRYLCHTDKIQVSLLPIRIAGMKRCVVGIRRPDASEPVANKVSDAPTVWFPSMPTLAAVLSEDNRALLRLIHDQCPPSLTALAELTGRQVPNLSRTLRMMENYGLVKLKK